MKGKRKVKRGKRPLIAPNPKIHSPSHAAFLADIGELVHAVARAKRNEQAVRRNLRLRAPLGPKDHVKPRKPGSRVSPYRGVAWNIRDRLWVVRIKVDGRSRVLGVFTDTEANAMEAAKLHDRWAWYYYGSRAKLNFPEAADRTRVTVYRPTLIREDIPVSLTGATEKTCSRCRHTKPLAAFNREAAWKLRDFYVALETGEHVRGWTGRGDPALKGTSTRIRKVARTDDRRAACKECAYKLLTNRPCVVGLLGREEEIRGAGVGARTR